MVKILKTALPKHEETLVCLLFQGLDRLELITSAVAVRKTICGAGEYNTASTSSPTTQNVSIKMGIPAGRPISLDTIIESI